MKFFNLFLAALFFTFAGLQLNDNPEDVWFWLVIYFVIGILLAFAAFNKYNMWIILACTGAIVYQLFRLFPAFSSWISAGTPSITGEMKAISPHVELVREFLGLLICLAALVYLYVRYSRIRKETPIDLDGAV